MPFHFLEDLTVADLAFQAEGRSLDELFGSAWQATLGVMIDSPESLHPAISREIALEAGAPDLLLYSLLEELLFYKDAEGLLLRLQSCRVRRCAAGGRDASAWRLQGLAAGERIDPGRHRLGVDVKAVTFHHLSVRKTGRRWLATVVLDV